MRYNAHSRAQESWYYQTDMGILFAVTYLAYWIALPLSLYAVVNVLEAF